MVYNHRDRNPPLRARGSGIPIRATGTRRPGLRSGGQPPEPTTEHQPTRITIRVPPRTSNRGGAPPVVMAGMVGTPDPAPSQYTKREEPGPVTDGVPVPD